MLKLGKSILSGSGTPPRIPGPDGCDVVDGSKVAGCAKLPYRFNLGILSWIVSINITLQHHV